MIGREPLVDDFDHGKTSIVEDERARRLLAAMTCVAFNGDGQGFTIP